jgi:hypothetical protein
MNNKEITSINWLEKQMDDLYISYQKGFMTTARFIYLGYKLFEQAKEMHKTEIAQAYDDGVEDECIYATFSARDFDKTGEQYYKEKYERNN